MRVFTFQTEITVPENKTNVFNFFANAQNLQIITPPWLNFKILTPTPIELKPGSIIDYSLRWRGIPVKWKTEITKWVPNNTFTDKQIKGPYKLWEHEHLFQETDEGTNCIDIIRYAPPFQPFSISIVQKDVHKIFEYRKAVIQKMFSR